MVQVNGMVELTCYNKACSNKGKFVESENGPEACRFHPGKNSNSVWSLHDWYNHWYCTNKYIEFIKGGPVFHDALKGWSCCKKRVTDFGEFLAMPGCTAGPHSEQD